MKKWLKVVFIILLLLTSFYSVIATVAIVEIQKEESLKYNELFTKYKEISEKYTNSIIDKIAETPVILSGVASSINEKSSISRLNDKIVVMTVPYSKDIKTQVEKYVSFIPPALDSGKLNSCIIIATDDNDRCVLGWTISKDGNSYPFISDLY
jgi:ABC-type multidrug transport system fused ATPase/permease subunit